MDDDFLNRLEEESLWRLGGKDTIKMRGRLQITYWISKVQVPRQKRHCQGKRFYVKCKIKSHALRRNLNESQR
jgi:hypothetical protein